MKRTKVSCREGDSSKRQPKAHCLSSALSPYQALPLFAMLQTMNLQRKWGVTMVVLILVPVLVEGNVLLAVLGVALEVVLGVVREDVVVPVLWAQAMEDGKMRTYSGRDIMSLTDSRIQELLTRKVVHVRVNNELTYTGKVVNFFQAESNMQERRIAGMILNEVDLPFSTNLTIEVQE